MAASDGAAQRAQQARIGGVRAGQFREPFSLEELTSSNHIAFMERSPMNALVPSRNLGVMVHDHSEAKTMTWAAGVFRDDGADTGINAGDGEQSLTGRVTYLPVYEDEGRHLIHVGGAYSHREGDEETFRIRSRGPSGLLANDAVDTGTFAADSWAICAFLKVMMPVNETRCPFAMMLCARSIGPP